MSKIKKIKPSTIKRALRLHEEWVEYKESSAPERPKGREIILTNEIIRKINFTENDLFAGANLRYLNASNLDFLKINFSRANFSETDFEGADFENSNFEGVLAYSVNFSHTDFTEANFKNTNFKNSRFIRSCFKGTYLSDVNFENVNFENAKFLSVDFKNSVFSGTNFSNAIFTGIALQYTVTAGIQGFQVISCQLNSSEENRVVQYWPELDIVTAGCFSGTLKELKKKIKETHKDNPDMRKKYNLVLDYIENMVKLG